MKLSHKLTLAFLLVSLIAIGMAALFVWVTTATEFSQYLVNQRQAEFIKVTTDYYKSNGNWQGVDAALRSAGLLPPFGADQPDPQPFALAGQDRVIIISGGKYETGQKVKQGILERGIGIEVGGMVVGTVLITGDVPAPSSIEQKYIDSVNRSLLIAGLGASLVALVLGFLVARSFSRPIRELTKATRSLSSGKPGAPISFNSNDELGELASSFNQMSSDLTMSNQSRRQMTADIAHDLRNPLTVIGGYLESLQDGKLAPTPERIAVMQGEVNHLQHLVEDLRILSLADSGDLVLHPQLVSVPVLLQQVKKSYQHQADDQKVELSLECEPNLPDIRLDADRMEQVLENLVSNALRYTPEGGKIGLRAYTLNDSLTLEVNDTGCGINSDVLPHIFERSYRGDPARSGDKSGLGLAIARSIVTLLGGEIKAASEGKGQGSVFRISFPIAGQ